MLILIAVLSFFILLSVFVPKTLRKLFGKVSITIVWVLLVASCLGIIVCPAIFIFAQLKHGLRGVAVGRKVPRNRCPDGEHLAGE